MFAQTPPIGFERHEENIGIVYTPSAWGIWNDGRASRGSYAGSNTAGQTASLTFTGTWAGVGFLVTADGGQAEVFLDGLSQGVVDNYGHDVNVASWYYRDLVSATHTISISVLSTRHANSSGNWVRLDYIDTWDGSDIPGGSFEENNSRVISSGNWAQDSSASASGGQYYRDGTALWFPFTGSSVTYQALATYWAGEVEVLLDGQLQGRMNLQSDTTMTRTFSFGNLADSAHVLQVRNYRGRATVDAFLTPGTMPYYQPPTHTGLSRYEEDDAALRYNGASYSQMPQTWNIWNDGGLLSDGYAVFTNYSNQTVTLVFTGTWAGLGYVSRYNGGQVEVLLDGVSQGTLDTYTPANIPQSVYYDNLGAGQHTLTVRTLGTQNPNSSGTHFYFDYFDVWDGSSLPSGTSETPFAATWNWASGTDASASGGQYYRDGTALWFPFTGQSVTYQALATYWAGEVEVSIDGTTHGTVSLYAPTTVTRTFDYTGLGAGAHVLRVQASSGRATVDAVIVPPTSQPTVDFEATPMTGFAPLVVTFTNQTVPTATISSYQWNFGDGYTATVTNPVHVYSSTGVFTVALTASTSDAQVAVTKTNYITVTAAPIITTVVVITYTYDPLNRLTDATYSDGQQFQYAYDAVGNRTTQTATITSTQVTNYVYDAANRLTSVNGQAYTWDDNGNLVNDGAKTYTYNQANQLTNLTQGATTFQFAYNGDGARLKQIVNGTVTTYTLDLAAPLVQVLMMQDTGGKTAYLYGVTRIGEQQSAGWLYHLSDALGSVRQLADSSGNVQLARGYTPYGEPLWTNGTASSRYAFTGEDYDPTVGLVFLRARYLQPTLGIFLARDPWSGEATRPGSMNGWNYVEGDPIDRADPTGLCRLLKFPVFSVNLPMCVVEPDDWMWKIARQYGIEPVYFVSSNEAFLRTQGVTNMHDIDPGMLVLIPHVPGTGSSTMPHPVPGSFQGSWGGYLYGTFTQFTRPHIGNKSLAWDLQGWCDDPPIAGEGNETVIDMGRGEKATYKYYYVAKSKGSSGVLAVSLGEYAGLITGFTDGPQSITLNEYAGLSVCTVVPWGYGDVPGLSTTKLFGVGVAVGLCGPGKFTGPWTADYSNAPGLWTAVIQGTFSIGLSVDTTSEVIVNYIRTSPVMRANQTEMNDAYTYIHTYGK